MSSDSDIGENTAIVLTVGLALGFTAWLVKQAIDLSRPVLPPADSFAALRVTELKRVTEAELVLHD